MPRNIYSTSIMDHHCLAKFYVIPAWSNQWPHGWYLKWIRIANITCTKTNGHTALQRPNSICGNFSYREGRQRMLSAMQDKF